jgi:hypothetical protein
MVLKYSLLYLEFYDDQWSKFKENQFLTLVDPAAQSSPSI